ncbi:MAG: HNH endonuclease [Bdellovibrionales bacterium]|nr:HNH endonuclease [Bdellovibrionales bacterium]
MTSSLEGVRVLVLNASYEPIRIVHWQRAMVLALGGKIEILESYPDVFVRTVSEKYPVPAVIKLSRFFTLRKLRTKARFTRQHVFARDGFRCQYCKETFPSKELTLDHVVPLVRGGRTSWSNIVACCADCNQKKGGRTPQEAGLQLLKVPKEPQIGFIPDLLFYSNKSMPEPWRPFVNATHLTAY